MKKIKNSVGVIALFAVLFASCGIKSVNCKHVRYITVTYQKDSANFYDIQVPFCDTVYLTTKKKAK